jgi:hypothetical protein
LAQLPKHSSISATREIVGWILALMRDPKLVILSRKQPVSAAFSSAVNEASFKQTFLPLLVNFSKKFWAAEN